MTLRIIAGLYKGRPLKTPKGPKTRPTQSKLREALFNICQQSIQGARFLDLFAGSGAMGIEALSRGASHATFVENNGAALRCIRENIAALQLESQTTVARSLKALSSSFDIAYVDPPYDTPTTPILEQLLPFLVPNALLFVEERSNIHRGIEKLGIGQGGSPDFLAGARGHCQRQDPKRGRKIWGKADAGQNQFFGHDVYTLFSSPELLHIDSRRFGIALLHQYRVKRKS